MTTINQIPAGKQIPNDFNVIIEIPANSGPVKYEVDKESGLLIIDRFMPTSMYYPCDYGFIPSTLAEDGDPIDVLVITPHPVQPACLIRCRALGLLRMTDEKGEDSKILAVPIGKVCMQYAHIKSLKDISHTILNSIVHFFEHYKELESGKWVKVQGWENIDAATQEIQHSIARYASQEKVSV